MNHKICENEKEKKNKGEEFENQKVQHRDFSNKAVLDQAQLMRFSNSAVTQGPKNGTKGPFNNYVDKMRGGGGQKPLFLSTLLKGIKTVLARGKVKK